MEQLGGAKGIGRLKAVSQELAYGLVHLPRSRDQKLKPNEKEAQDFLTRLRDILPQQNLYFSPEDNGIVPHYVASGFSSACYEFKSSTGKWVIKVGHDKSPMRTQFHPSSEGHAKSYLRNLEIQRTVFAVDLPHFIPEPQGIFYVQGERRATTVIVQPFIDYLSPFDKKMNLNQAEKQQLQGEWDMLQRLMVKMRKDYGIMPDFMNARGKEGHLVVVQKSDGVHLVMLDNVMFDEKEDPIPALHLANKALAEVIITRQRRKLKD